MTMRTALIAWPAIPAPTFQPNRERIVCDDKDGRVISRHSSAPFV